VKRQYFGDIHDYRKYGLIRALSDFGTLSTYICWMLTPDAYGNLDGQKTSYLSKPEIWRHFDPYLYDFLQNSVNFRQADSVIDENAISAVLPGAQFHTPLLIDAALARTTYFSQLFESLPTSSGLLFFDPDNGLEVPSCRKGRKNSSKYLYWDEVSKAYESGHSVLIYQHFQRIERKKFIQSIAAKANAETGATVFTYITSHVVFFLLARPEHVKHFQSANAYITNQWYRQIIVTPTETKEQFMAAQQCQFCSLNTSRIIISNTHATAIYDGFPVSPGHSLIIPNRHIASFFEASKEEQSAMLELLSEMRQLLQQERNPAGFNIGINDGASAGQTVMHLHIHLIPRYNGDTKDPRGGVRWIMPDKAPYWRNL